MSRTRTSTESVPPRRGRGLSSEASVEHRPVRGGTVSAGGELERVRELGDDRLVELGLEGRTALVGGASSGLGAAVAEALAAEGCRRLFV